MTSLYDKAKELMAEHPDCAYNGDFWTNHVYDPARPWRWVDFRFFHTTQRKYYAVAMITAIMEAAENIESAAVELACDLAPPYAHDGPEMRFNGHRNAFIDTKTKELIFEACKEPAHTVEGFDLHYYDAEVIGVFATVNRKYIDEHSIREFIAHFRSLGEPTDSGWRWTGEDITIDPKELQDYFAGAPASKL